MNIYLAGPMRNIPEFNFPAFHAAAAELRALGHEVFNPADHDMEVLGKDFVAANYPTGNEDDLAKDTTYTIRAALGADLAWICAKAEGIVLLPGWENSRGANAEFATAKAIGLPNWFYPNTPEAE